MSEGRDPRTLGLLRDAADGSLLDLHADPSHHRSVFTLAGTHGALLDHVEAIAEVAIASIDLHAHEGVHPRFGALDVVPFAPLRDGPLDEAIAAREDVLGRLSALGLACFRYGPLEDGTLRTLPEVRRGAFVALRPDAGPRVPHPTAGAVAVGAREPLVAWNVWLAGVPLDTTRWLAGRLRSAQVRTLGLAVEGGTQVSCNLLAPSLVTPHVVYGRLRELLTAYAPPSARIERCELVGLVPAAVLRAVPESAWACLGLSAESDVERRLAERAGIGAP